MSMCNPGWGCVDLIGGPRPNLTPCAAGRTDNANGGRREVEAMNGTDIQAELRRAQDDFHRLVARATPEDLRRCSRGTRWSNRQLLFHMLFGYIIVRTLM